MAKAKSKGKKEQDAAPVSAAPGRKFKTIRNVTLPVLSAKIETPLYVRIQSEMRVGKEMKAGAGEAKKAPATLCTATNLETGEVVELIVSAVVKSVFEENYPDGAYVGKSFCLVKHAKKEGKNYFNFSVDEIDPEQPTETAP
jgi:hypothetical protein